MTKLKSDAERGLNGMPNNRWRVGTKVPLNVYDGDRAVCQCHNPEDAARIVEAVNAAITREILDDLIQSEIDEGLYDRVPMKPDEI